MDLKVEILNTNLRENANYFLMVQMDEMEFPEKNVKTFKYRTEIIPMVSQPFFSRNLFNFNGLSFGSRLTLKIGCFSTSLLSETEETNLILVSKCNNYKRSVLFILLLLQMQDAKKIFNLPNNNIFHYIIEKITFDCNSCTHLHSKNIFIVKRK
jgi:hypothetical protein